MTTRSAAFAAALALCGATLIGGLSSASAQDKFDRPVKMLVGFPAGGTADLIARVVADKMKDTLGQPVIVENRPGAIGRIAADAVKAAAPDGTTLMVMPIGPMAVVPHVYADITYDPVKDFTPVALGATFQFAIAAGPQSGAKRSTVLPDVPTFAELGLKVVEAIGWFGFFAPARTPKPIVDALNRAINKSLQSPDVIEKLSKVGMDPATSTPEEFGRIVAADYAKWGPVVKASGFKPE